jgi:putative heme-binding domain-containing protein
MKKASNFENHRACPWWAGTLLLLTVHLHGATPADIAQGKAIYGTQCAPCHGMTGEGGYGAPLNRVKLVHAPDNTALFRTIKFGITGTNMPGFGLLPDAEIEEVAQYVRTLGAIETATVPGDGKRGKLLFESKGGCSACHIIEGKGNGFGPELTDVGVRRSVPYLQTKLNTPGASVTENYWTVEIRKPGGETLRALWVNEDSFSLQVRDQAGQIRSFRKEDLASYQRLDKISLMPSFSQVLTKSEIDDVVSYLALRGAR